MRRILYFVEVLYPVSLFSLAGHFKSSSDTAAVLQLKQTSCSKFSYLGLRIHDACKFLVVSFEDTRSCV